MSKKTSFFIISLFFSIFIVGGFFWWGNGLQPVDSEDKEKIFFTVNKGDGLSEVAERLEDNRLVKSSLHFRIFAILNGTAKKIKAGGYYLTKSMKPSEITENLTKGVNDQWVTIVEGLRSEEIGQFLIKQGFAIDPQMWDKQVKKDNLEGKLFPDSYLIPIGADQEKILQIISRNFQKKVTEGLSGSFANTQLESKEAITLASIVEREAKHSEDKAAVAGILIKRLNESWPLQVDASVQYAVGSKKCSILKSPCDWWPNPLSLTDLKIVSGFNTYLNRGLPTGPICNPGLASIKAVLEPKESNYWYYISDKAGNMHYAKTDIEHQANIEKYLR